MNNDKKGLPLVHTEACLQKDEEVPSLFNYDFLS